MCKRFLKKHLNEQLTLVFRWQVSLILLAFFPSNGFSQQDIEQEESDRRHQQTVLDRSPILSPRAKAMGGALSGIAEGIDATYYNPAGIGGIGFRESYPRVRQLSFPAAGVSVNNNFSSVHSEFTQSAADETLKRGIINAYANQRFYSRLGLFPNVVIGRTIVGAIADQQFAAVPYGGDSDLVATRFRELQGYGAGFSMTDRDNRLFVGVYYFSLDRRDVVGDFLFRDVELPESREQVFSENSFRYSGNGYHAGLLWRVAHPIHPTFSLVLRNVGHTTYHSKDPNEYDDLRERQDMTFGFTLSPSLSSWGRIHVTLQADGLDEVNRSIEKKLRLGGELLFFEDDQRAPFALRAGLNSAGFSYGAHIHLNLISLQYADYAEDVGILNHKVIDRRQEIMAVIDLAEY